jgi:hypothetical protein
VYGGFGGISSGLRRGRASAASDFLRFLFDLMRVIEFVLGNDNSGSGGTFLSGKDTSTAATGGEHGGIEDGGEMEVTSSDVMSTEGERRRFSAEEWEEGEGESSGGSRGGGRTK